MVLPLILLATTAASIPIAAVIGWKARDKISSPIETVQQAEAATRRQNSVALIAGAFLAYKLYRRR